MQSGTLRPAADATWRPEMNYRCIRVRQLRVVVLVYFRSSVKYIIINSIYLGQMVSFHSHVYVEGGTLRYLGIQH